MHLRYRERGNKKLVKFDCATIFYVMIYLFWAAALILLYFANAFVATRHVF